MATDRKADYAGNHGGAYTDMDGMSRQFTTIDHDKKTTISMHTSHDEQFPDMRSSFIKRITDLPASICPDIFTDFTLRGDGKSVIEWNVDMLLDEGIPISQLRDLATLLENRAEAMRLIP